MFTAAFRSAWYSNTHHFGFVHQNSAYDDRFPMWPQAWHVWLVYAGATNSTRIPVMQALSTI